MDSLRGYGGQTPSEAERWKILQDTQTRIFAIQQDISVNKSQTQDRAYKKWDEYIGPGKGSESAKTAGMGSRPCRPAIQKACKPAVQKPSCPKPCIRR